MPFRNDFQYMTSSFYINCCRNPYMYIELVNHSFSFIPYCLKYFYLKIVLLAAKSFFSSLLTLKRRACCTTINIIYAGDNRSFQSLEIQYVLVWSIIYILIYFHSPSSFFFLFVKLIFTNYYSNLNTSYAQMQYLTLIPQTFLFLCVVHWWMIFPSWPKRLSVLNSFFLAAVQPLIGEEWNSEDQNQKALSSSME